MSSNQKHITVRLANWSTEKEILSNIRTKVFIEEQLAPQALEWDDLDESSTHYLAEIDGTTVATARLKTDGQLGRMAVLKKFRNQGIGSKLLQFILQNNTNKQQLYLHAQVSAIPFYQKQGFIEYDDIFYEANIPHRKMIKK